MEATLQPFISKVLKQNNSEAFLKADEIWQLCKKERPDLDKHILYATIRNMYRNQTLQRETVIIPGISRSEKTIYKYKLRDEKKVAEDSKYFQF